MRRYVAGRRRSGAAQRLRMRNGGGKVMQRISALIDLEEDRVDVYRQCRTCWEDGMAIGLVAPRTITPYWAVF